MNYFIDNVYIDDLQDNTPFLCVPQIKNEGESMNKANKNNNIVIDKIDN